MPTLDEIAELVNNCSWKWTTYNGVNGQLVTGPNGNSIFLPAAGCRYGTRVLNVGNYGFYWSATQYESDGRCAYELFFGIGSRLWNYWNGRNCGSTVRPVSD